MGTLDTLISGLSGSLSASKSKKPDNESGLSVEQTIQFVKTAAALVSKLGLPKLVELFNSAGLNKQIKSWIGKGKNLSVSGEQVESALGTKLISELAEKSGITKPKAANGLAAYLPKVIDLLTPDGQADAELIKKETSSFDLGDMASVIGLGSDDKANFLSKAGGLLNSFLKRS